MPESPPSPAPTARRAIVGILFAVAEVRAPGVVCSEAQAEGCQGVDLNVHTVIGSVPGGFQRLPGAPAQGLAAAVVFPGTSRGSTKYRLRLPRQPSLV